MRILGFAITSVSLMATIINSFFIAWSPLFVKGIVDFASIVCVLGCVIGTSLVAYGSELGKAFKTNPSQEEAMTAINVYKLAARVSIGSGLIGVMIGLLAMLGNMGGVGMDIAALTGGTATALLTSLYGLVFSFCLFLPLQYYFQSQLDKDS